MKRPKKALAAAAGQPGDEELFEFSGTITDYWSYTQVRDYLMLMPGMTHVAYRLYSLLRSMIAEASRRRNDESWNGGMRRMTIDQLCWLMPGPKDKPTSVSTMYEVLGTLEALNLVVPKDTRELEGISQLKGKQRAAKGISRGFIVNDLPPDAVHTGWRNAWDKLDAYTPDWRENPPAPPTHLTEVETLPNGQTLATVRLVDAQGKPFQKTGTPQVTGDQSPSFQKTGTPDQKTGTADQKTGTPDQISGTDLPLTSGNDHPLRSSLQEASSSLVTGAPSEPGVPAEPVTGGEEDSASPEKDTPAPAAGADPNAHADVRVAEAWIAARQTHGHEVPARARKAMLRDASQLLAEGVNVDYLVAAAADMGSRENWFNLERHLERFVMPKQVLPGQRPELPEWCGTCNDGVEPAQPGHRLREADGGRLVRCECHPSHPSNAKTPVPA
ncbi:hypothetical protein AMK23_34230 [Streptomyces sp. CB02130]|uniref:hypothetical protein n=1 Tax=Streptomyces sp. CB02130 TaxID=1703934 RepID=UPI00093F4DEA|nr:hypothetical protein [Streptomyces sp. CB02130]OKJ19360.1 hypothetical protein AMK23_34230 [Streptomyces sp. CB02130]